MKRQTLERNFFCTLFAALFVMSLTGCVEAPPPRPIMPPPPPPVIVQQTPPTEIVEEIPPAPGPSNVWVWQKGHWRWNGSSYKWQRGHWVERPAYASAWVPPHWQASPGGYIFVEGAWR